MHVTFDLAEIKEMMPQQARKQLEAELETNCCNLGGVCCLYTAVLVSPVQSIVQSSPKSRFYRDPEVTLIYRDSTKPGLWTLDWTVDWTLDSKMDSVFRLEFQLPGVKGHVHINQQHYQFCISENVVVFSI